MHRTVFTRQPAAGGPRFSWIDRSLSAITRLCPVEAASESSSASNSTADPGGCPVLDLPWVEEGSARLGKVMLLIVA